MQPASKQDAWAQESLFSDPGVFPWLSVSVPAGTRLPTDKTWSDHRRWSACLLGKALAIDPTLAKERQ